MMVSEEEYSELVLTIAITRDDVALLIDVMDDYESLSNALKEYFELNDQFYKEREAHEKHAEEMYKEIHNSMPLNSANIDQCEYCHAGRYEVGRRDNIGKPIADGAYEVCFIDLDNNELVVVGDDEGTTKINFCPMCGRDLNKLEQDNETNL